MAISRQIWGEILYEAITTRADEIGCDECYESLGHFAELVLTGQDAASVMPRVYDHLVHCRECRDESEALVAALRGTARFALPSD
jgi:predicted anti-sigma-YlaC factor YlaD